MKIARLLLWLWLVGLVALAIVGLAGWVEDSAFALVRATALLCLATAMFALPVGTAVAWLVSRTDLPGRTTLAQWMIWPLFIPLYLQAAAWRAGFGSEGWYRRLLGGAVWLDGWLGAIWIHGWAAVPWVVLIVGVGLRTVEADLERAALLEAGTGLVMFRVTLRRAAGFVGAAALWVVVSVAGEMTVTDLFRIRTYAEVLYTDLAMGELPTSASLKSLPALILGGWMMLSGVALGYQLLPATHSDPEQRRAMFRLDRWRWALVAGVLAVALLMVAVPVGNLCYKAGLVVEQVGDQRLRHWSATRASLLLIEAPVRSFRPLAWSLVIAAVSATMTLLTALGVAWLVRERPRLSLLIWPVVGALLAMPGPLIALAWIWVFNREDPPLLAACVRGVFGRDFQLLPFLYDRTVLVVCLGLWLRTLPVVLLVVWYAMATLRPAPLEAAATEGAGTMVRLWRIALPQHKETWAAAWLIGVVLCYGDLSTTILLLPPGITTMSVHIFNLLHYGVDDLVAADCLLSIAGLLIAGLLVRRWIARRRHAG